MTVANACLNVISANFDEEATKKATADYFTWIKDAKEYEIKEKTGSLTQADKAKRASIELDKKNDPMYKNELEIHLM